MSSNSNTLSVDDEYFIDDHISPKLLVVGDTTNQFARLVSRLNTLNINIFTVDHCKDAIDIAQDHDFFLILMGAEEIRRGGVEMAFALRAHEATRNVPVVFISQIEKGVGDTEDSYGFGIAGSDYVITPVNPDVVEKEVSVFLDMYRHRKELEYSEQLYKTMATRDPLTLLGNRDQFESDLKKALANAKRHGYMIAVLYVDLDKFKPINDDHGHKVGDQVLIEIANRLKSCTREGDFLARMGGDEFCVLLNMIRDADSAGMVAKKIIKVLTAPMDLKKVTVSVGASVGVAFYPKHGDNYETLLHNADMAMYKAKRSGRNDYRYFHDD